MSVKSRQNLDVAWSSGGLLGADDIAKVGDTDLDAFNADEMAVLRSAS